jgi:HK97 family phage portal protein
VNIVINNLTREVTSYIVRDAKNGTETQYAPDEFVHFRFADPDNDLYGLSPLESLISTVAQDLFAQTYNEAFFANSAQTGIVFNMRNASKEEVERNREFLKKEYTSAANAHKPLLLEGDVDVSKSVSSPAEMQFIEGRKQLTMEILAVFDLPYTKLGGTSESANRSQSAENDKTFRSETIKPLQSVIEEVINEQLLYVIFNIKDTLFQHAEVDYRDESAQMDMYIKGLSHGIYTINYVRNKLGLPPIEGGDVASLSTPLGLMPVQEVESAAQAILAAKTGAPANPQV